MYWSYSPFEPYFEERLSEEWYQEIKDEREAFSRVHTCGYPENSRYLTYLLSIPDKGTPDKELGKLLLNINVQYFSDIIGETAGLSSGYFVSDLRDGTVILGQGNQETNIRLAEKMAASVQSEKKYRGEMEIGSGDKGYCLWSAFPDAGIGVGMYTSSGLLFQYSEQMRYFFVVYSVSTAAAILLLTFLLIRKFLQPISQISAAMLDFSGGKRKILEIKTGDELEMLSCQFNKMAERIEEFIKRRIQDERINKKLKFDMLMSKIHPHFLYNTLNSVIYLARRDHNQDIEKMVQSLILILQDGMAAYSGESCAMLKEELEVVSAYCVIQNYRYKDKVSVNIEVPDELTTAYVPKNILQPLVENAIYHGIAPMEENGTIEILAERREEMLDLWVIDTGIGMDENELKGLEQNGKGHSGVHSIGIKSIRERLEYLYPEHYSFEIYSEKGKGNNDFNIDSLPEGSVAAEGSRGRVKGRFMKNDKTGVKRRAAAVFIITVLCYAGILLYMIQAQKTQFETKGQDVITIWYWDDSIKELFEQYKKDTGSTYRLNYVNVSISDYARQIESAIDLSGRACRISAFFRIIMPVISFPVQSGKIWNMNLMV